MVRSQLAYVASMVLGTVLLAACERPPVDAIQLNFRGLGAEEVVNPRLQSELLEANQAPDPLPPVDPGGPKSSEIYQNVQVLGHTNAAEFTRLMGAITLWVSPQQGCTYCHGAGGFADDSMYTKTVSRRMIQMTQHINSEWKDHVGETGVTCYTCHRGQGVPSNYWVLQSDERPMGLVGNKAGQNSPANDVGLASLPYDPFGPYLRSDTEIRVQGGKALPNEHVMSIQQTEKTYGLMMHVSNALGVNCNYCHNSRSFSPWETSTPQRVTAWYGIRMVRDINTTYMESLTDVFPDNRKGPEGDVFKVNCTTCHQGVAKPLYGASMLKDYPNLAAPHP